MNLTSLHLFRLTPKAIYAPAHIEQQSTLTDTLNAAGTSLLGQEILKTVKSQSERRPGHPLPPPDAR